MKYISLFVLILISNLSFSQDRYQIYSEIFEAIFCKPSSNEKQIVSFISAFGIDKYEFYQDYQSLNKTYRLINPSENQNTKSDQQINLSISHNIVINHYDKVPYKVISTYTRIDTTEVNKNLFRVTDNHGDQVIWKNIVDNCDNLKFIKKLRPTIIRILFNQNCLFAGSPILFSDNNYAIIKVVNLRLGSKIKDVDTKIYFLEFSDNSWTIKEIFKVINTSTLTNEPNL